MRQIFPQSNRAADFSPLSSSAYMLANGSAVPGALTLDDTMLSPFSGNKPPCKAADLTKSFAISQTGIVKWVVDQYPYSEARTPILYGNASEGWMANTTRHLPFNSTVDIVMTIASGSMDTVSKPLS